MKYHHHFSLQEIEELIPWQRTVYIQLITNEIEKEK